MAESILRVLVVDDTVVYRKIVADTLSAIPGVEVVGTAANGRLALDKIRQTTPDLITLDLEMPEIDGLGVLRGLREIASPPAAIMLSAFTTEGARTTMEALRLGAFDFVVKPTGNNLETNGAYLRRELEAKLKAFSRTQALRPSRPQAPTPNVPPPASDNAVPQRIVPRTGSVSATRKEIVVIGISTGGPKALTRMMPMLPGDLAVPILIVQHMPPMFTKSLADDLNNRCKLAISEGSDGQIIQPGEAIIAPGGKQMRVDRQGSDTIIRITDDPPEKSCKPSADYLFRSVANVYAPGAVVAAIMTGMGNDGAMGCRLIKRRTGTIIAQNQETCVVYGMPREPIDEGIADYVLPLDEIAGRITELAGRRVAVCK